MMGPGHPKRGSRELCADVKRKSLVDGVVKEQMLVEKRNVQRRSFTFCYSK